MISEKGLFVVMMLLLTSACFPGICGVEEDDSSDEDDEAKCSPVEADTCFSEVNENLLCHVVSPKGRNCTHRTARDFCLSLDDALNCTSDIIDSDCTADEGRIRFDNWLQGLRGAYGRLCQRDGYDLIDNLLTSNSCWNFKTFTKCVEKKANLTHINDLLVTDLDETECNLLLMAVSICNEKAEKSRVKCRGKGDAVSEAVAAFFASSPCKGKTPLICNVLQPNEIRSNPAKSSSSSTVAVILTLFVTFLIAGIATVILVWRNVITINARCRMMHRASEGDDVVDSREDYGRFL